MRRDVAEDLLEEDDLIKEEEEEAGLTEVSLKVEGKVFKSLVDTGSEVSVIAENILDELKKQNVKIPTLPVAGVIIVGVTGVRSKRVTKQVHLNLEIENKEYDNTFLVVKGLNLDIILGNDFLKKYGAIIDFRNRVLELNGHGERVSVNLERVASGGRVAGMRVLVIEGLGSGDTEFRVNACERGENEMSGEQKWESRAQLFFNSGGDMESQNKCELWGVIEGFKEVFSDLPGEARNYVCELRVREHAPFVQRSYPVPYSKRVAVQEELDRMLEGGIIEKSVSPYSNPLVVVIKKDGRVRLCLDARKINQIIIPDRESPEPIDEIFQKFSGVKYLTSFDLTAGYWQIPLAPESRKYTAFLFNGRNYQFKRLPFGLNTSVASFIKCLDAIVQPSSVDFVTLYVDDILIASRSFEEHKEHLQYVLNKLKRGGLTVNWEKSKLLQHEINFLGYIISPEGIRANPDKVESIVSFPEPKNIKQLQSFLGVCNFYRKFQHQYADLTTRLSTVLQKSKSWRWGEGERAAFQEIKTRFAGMIMLNHPDFKQTFYLQTDASNIALGAELYQEGVEGERKTIAFASRALLIAERNYTTTEKELLSIVFAVRKFRTYLLGNTVVVRTDHKALSFLNTCKLTHGRLMRWVLVLQEYNMSWEYIKGADNKVPDILSRVDVDNNETGRDIREIEIFRLSKEDKLFGKNLEGLSSMQRADPKLGKIINSLESGKVDANFVKFFRVYKDILYKKIEGSEREWKLVLPEGLIEKVVWDCHVRYGHFGSKKVARVLKESCIFKNMEKKVRKLIKTCDLCQKSKVINYRQEGEMRCVKSEHPFDLVAVDLFGPLPKGRGGVTYIFVLLDTFTKFIKLYSVKKATSKVLSEKITQDYMRHVGKPKVILSDHGPQFTSGTWRQTLGWEGILTKHTAVYHPQSNQAERMMREIGRILRAYCHEKHSDWPLYVGKIETWLNSTTHESTGFTPWELVYGKRPERILEQLFEYPPETPMGAEVILELVNQRLFTKGERRKLRHDNKGKSVKYNIGDLVLVKTHNLSNAGEKQIKKFFLLYEGPYEVVEIKMDNAYTVRNPVTKEVVGTHNVVNLKTYHS